MTQQLQHQRSEQTAPQHRTLSHLSAHFTATFEVTRCFKPKYDIFPTIIKGFLCLKKLPRQKRDDCSQNHRLMHLPAAFTPTKPGTFPPKHDFFLVVFSFSALNSSQLETFDCVKPLDVVDEACAIFQPCFYVLNPSKSTGRDAVLRSFPL